VIVFDAPVEGAPLEGVEETPSKQDKDESANRRRRGRRGGRRGRGTDQGPG
jgi:hypothetical protein